MRLPAWLSGLEMPVLTRELRGRMRGNRAFIVMFIYTAVLSATAIALLGAMAVQYASASARMAGAHYPGGIYPAHGSAQSLGRALFLALAVAQLQLIAVITPALTCGSMSGEWERKTMEMLALTTMSSGSVIVGKLLASLCYVGLLLVCAAPVFALTLMIGGVSPMEIVLTDLVCLGTALLVGALGLLASTMVQRTYIATALAYGGTGVMAVALVGAIASGYVLIPLGGFILSGILTGIARGLVPRWRPGWRPERVTYIIIFGLCLALVAGLMNTGLLETTDAFLSVTFLNKDPVEMLASASGALAAVVGGLSFLGAAAAVLGAVSVFRAMGAPQPDPLETQARVALQLRSQPAARGMAS